MRETIRIIKRFYTIFNPTPVYRREPVEIVVWEWEGNFDAAVFKDLNGNVLKHQFLANEQKYFWNDHYWFFKYRQALVELELPPYSYVSCILDEAPCKNVPIWTAPVSYTHLDVYKRQHSNTFETCRSRSRQQSPAASRSWPRWTLRKSANRRTAESR